MSQLFDELKSKELQWYCNVNMYTIATSLEVRFLKNWEYVFCGGLGLKEPMRTYVKERYINNLSCADIASKYGVKESIVQSTIDMHLEDLLSPRALILFEHDYPLQIRDMRKHQYNGYYDNYAEWHEPEYKSGNGYLNISLFDVFDNYYFRNFAKKNDIKSMIDLCSWIDENKENIQQKKAGIGKSTAKLLLMNSYVVKDITPESLEILQKMSVK